MAFKSNIYLRRAEREDLDTVVEWMEDEDFVRFLYGDQARSPQRVREQIVGMLGRTAGHMVPGGIYLLVDSTKYGPVGMLAINAISWRNRSCNVDTYIGNKKLRAGFTSAIAFYRTLEYCFHELNMHRVNLYVYSFNTASWRIIERSGAQRELTLHDHVLRDGKLHDMFGYALLDHEFEALFDEVKTKHPAATLEGNLDTYCEALAAEAEKDS
jgi:RimJ/RimL family protein N-acetyltransferase